MQVEQTVDAVRSPTIPGRLPAMTDDLRLCRLRPRIGVVVVVVVVVVVEAALQVAISIRKFIAGAELLARRHRRPATCLRRHRLRDGRHRWQRDRLVLHARTRRSVALRLWGAGMFGSRRDVVTVAVVGCARNRRRRRLGGNLILVVVYQHDVDRVDVLVVGLRRFL